MILPNIGVIFLVKLLDKYWSETLANAGPILALTDYYWQHIGLISDYIGLILFIVGPMCSQYATHIIHLT